MDNSEKHTVLFIYGTLKQNFPNHHLLSDLFLSGDATSHSPATTVSSYPLIVGPYAVPFLLPLPSIAGSHCISGEIISVSPHALTILDSFEGVSVGNYERDEVIVRNQKREEIQAQAYFAHRRFAEVMWRKAGEEGLKEYTEEMALEYVKPQDRPQGTGTLGKVLGTFLGLSEYHGTRECL